MSRPPVVVLGAGIAGLVAARQLLRRGLPVVVLEAGAQVAGMAASHTDEEGFSFDLGAHFVTNRLVAAVGGVQADVVRHYGERVVVGGRTLTYPSGLLRSPRYVASALSARAPGRRARGADDSDDAHDANDAASWFRATYGRALADEVAIPLVEAWSGAPAHTLSAAVGDKIPGGIARTVALRAASRVSRRAVAIGYCRARPESAAVFHVYPRGGVAALCRSLAAGLGTVVRLDSPVRRIHVDGDGVVGVSAEGGEWETDVVVSTAPVNVLPALAPGAASLARFAPFRFRPLLAVNLKLTGRHLLADTVVWTPGHPVTFRLTESTWSMPQLAPDGRTMVLVELNARPGDPAWDLDDDSLVRLAVDALDPLVDGVDRRLLGAHVQRLRLAYPTFDLAYEHDRADLELRGTGVGGLVSIGRNGEFAHLLMEDTYWRTVDHMTVLGDRLAPEGCHRASASRSSRAPAQLATPN